MKSFTEREKGFEAEFKRNQELMFRVTARRNRLFGLWAAKWLGLCAGEEAEAYAKTVVAADFEAPGDADVIEKVRTDLVKAGVAVTERELRAELERSAAEAHRQLAGS
jgi:hypothetical protein